MQPKNPSVKIVTSSGRRRLKVRVKVKKEQENPVSRTSRRIQWRPMARPTMEEGQGIVPAVPRIAAWATEAGASPKAKPK